MKPAEDSGVLKLAGDAAVRTMSGTEQELRARLVAVCKDARAFVASADPMPPDGIELLLELSKSIRAAEVLLFGKACDDD